jgi:hypothetical protein
MHRALRFLPLAAALAVALPAAAGEVYTWKDANGVTHYSQTPPRQGKYETRSMRHREPTPDGQPAAQVAATETPQCTTARRNIELLQSGSRLQMDSDGDGKPDRDLNDGEREKQLQIAQTVARVNCTAAPAKAP